MPSYDLHTCPSCEAHFRIIWPTPVPAYLQPCSKIKIACPACGEVTELYAFLLDTILQPPNPTIPSVQVEAISPPANPEPNARQRWQLQMFLRRAARFKAMYRN